LEESIGGKGGIASIKAANVPPPLPHRVLYGSCVEMVLSKKGAHDDWKLFRGPSSAAFADVESGEVTTRIFIPDRKLMIAAIIDA
jgi:hypothetical protein